MHHLTDRIAHTTAFVTPVVEHWLEREIAQWVHLQGSGVNVTGMLDSVKIITDNFKKQQHVLMKHLKCTNRQNPKSQN